MTFKVRIRKPLDIVTTVTGKDSAVSGKAVADVAWGFTRGSETAPEENFGDERNPAITRMTDLRLPTLGEGSILHPSPREQQCPKLMLLAIASTAIEPTLPR